MNSNQTKLQEMSNTLENEAGEGINADVERIITERNYYQTLLQNSVTGVKGQAETNYRTGDVNITLGNIGLSNVLNEKQYCAINPPPYPVSSVNGKTGEVGFSIKLSIDAQTYVVTAQLLDKSGEVLSSSTIDLPLETLVTSATYNSETKEIELTLQNGETISFSVADLVSGLVSQTTFDAHVNNQENPHKVTSSQLGLGGLSGGEANLFLRKRSSADNDFYWSPVEVSAPTVLTEEEYMQLAAEGRIDPTMIYYIQGTSDNQLNVDITKERIAAALGLSLEQMDFLIDFAKTASFVEVSGVKCLTAPGFNIFAKG